MGLNGIVKKTLLLVSVNICIFILYPPVSFSAEWRVTPIRIDLGKNAKTGVVTVINEGEAKLQVHLKAFEWTQDAEGKDQYAETNDIIFFPKIMVVEKKEERVVRAGIRMPAMIREKTYRLFIEEIPEANKTEGVHIAIAIRFGVPIFVKPIKEEAKGEIEKITLSHGVLNVSIKNTGNMHFIINKIGVKGTTSRGDEKTITDLSGWYLLGGSSRQYAIPIPAESCEDLKKIGIEVKTDKFILSGNVDADRALCLP